MRFCTRVRWHLTIAAAFLASCVNPGWAGGAMAGDTAPATGANATNVGHLGAAQGDNSVAVGVLSQAIGANTTAVGNLAAASGDNSVAVGALSRAAGANATAVGNLSAATGDNSTAFGVLGAASGANATAFGNLSIAAGANSSAVGTLSVARGANATAVGNQSFANGVNSTALGTQSLAGGDDSVAFGDLSMAHGAGSSAIGNGAMAFGANSIAIGSNSIADAPNVVSFGSPGAERRLVNLAPGVLPTDGATYGQLMTLANSINARFAALDQEAVKAPASVSTARARVSAGFEAIRAERPGGIGSMFAGVTGSFGSLATPIKTNQFRAGGARTLPERRAISPRTNPIRTTAAIAPAPQGSAAPIRANVVQVATRPVAQAAPLLVSAVAAPGSGAAQGASATAGPSGGSGSDTVSMSQLQGVAGGLQAQISGLQSQINDNLRESRAGVALAMASSGLQYDSRPGKASLAAAFGHYKGQSGLAVGLGYAVNSRWRINAAFTGTTEVSDYGVVAGSSWTLN